jgi:hypothetical protein
MTMPVSHFVRPEIRYRQPPRAEMLAILHSARADELAREMMRRGSEQWSLYWECVAADLRADAVRIRRDARRRANDAIDDTEHRTEGPATGGHLAGERVR